MKPFLLLILTVGFCAAAPRLKDRPPPVQVKAGLSFATADGYTVRVVVVYDWADVHPDYKGRAYCEYLDGAGRWSPFFDADMRPPPIARVEDLYRQRVRLKGEGDR